MFYADETGVAVVGSRKAPEFLGSVRDSDEDSLLEFTDEDDNSSLIHRQVTLQSHGAGVRSLSHLFAAGLPLELPEDKELSAWLHDIGKADRRFQLMLHGGDESSLANADQPLAKSGMDSCDPLYWQGRRISCYPDGGRHEAQSVALINAVPAVLETGHDRDLVLHLVGSHHGCGRPFMLVVHDPDPRSVSVSHGDIDFSASSKHCQERPDSGSSDRFWRLVRRYGRYGAGLSGNATALGRPSLFRRGRERGWVDIPASVPTARIRLGFFARSALSSF